MPRFALCPLLLLIFALAGCGAGTAADPPAGATTSGQPGPPGAGGDAAARSTERLPTERPIAEHRGRIDGTPVTVGLLPLRRRGGAISLQLVLTTRSHEDVDVYRSFDDGVMERDTDPDEVVNGREGFTVDGIALVDGTHRALFRPARDHFHRCVCDNTTDLQLNADAPLLLSATFGAPPGDVGAVDVVVPRFGTFVDVPLA